MRRVSSLCTSVVVGLVLAACNETTNAVTGLDLALERQGGDGVVSAGREAVALKPGAPLLASTGASIWAVQGTRTHLAIAFRHSSDGEAPASFLEFTIPGNVQLVDPEGRPLSRGDSILIEVHVVPGRLAAQFAPHGLTFGGRGRATLAMHYGYGDLQNRSPRGLGIWYRPDCDEPWQPQRSKIDYKAARVVAAIEHFSNYAVAF